VDDEREAAVEVAVEFVAKEETDGFLTLQPWRCQG
jgi:hypothetical protein